MKLTRLAVPTACLACFLVGVLVTDAAPAVTYKRYVDNLNAPLLFLDVGSLKFRGNHPFGPAVVSADDCKDRCKKVTGCTGYTYCNNTNGCGSGCNAYDQANPRAQIDFKVFAIAANTKVPLLGFGPFSACPFNSDKFPYGLCSLKAPSDPTKPAFWPNAGKDWVSGTIILPKECAGVSALACERCLKSSNPTECLKCARSQPDQRLAQAVDNGQYSKPYIYSLGCANCYTYTSGAYLNKCLQCIRSNTTCSDCVAQVQTAGLPTCLDCVRTSPYGALEECKHCSQLTSATERTQCFSCIARLKPAWCKSPPNRNSTSRVNCFDYLTQPCALCASSKTTDYETCVKCHLANPGSGDCGTCTLVPKDKQARCFKCAASAYGEFSPCADCINFSKDVNNCLTCVEDKTVTMSARTWCGGCFNWYNTPAGVSKCYACLRKPGTSDYFKSCAPVNKK